MFSDYRALAAKEEIETYCKEALVV